MKTKVTNQTIDNTFNRNSASLVNNTTIISNISNIELRDSERPTLEPTTDQQQRPESTRADAYQSRGSFSFLAMKL
jgi:hypothetical protein